MAPRSMKDLSPTASIEMVRGRGNLDARAYFAAIVGPARSVFGKLTSVELTESLVAQLVRNAAAADQWAYVTVVLPANVAGPKVAMFSSTPSIGFNTAMPVSLQRTIGAGGGNSFAAVLEPGDMLYARSGPSAGTFKVVVSTVWF